MQKNITKGCENVNNYKSKLFFFDRARDGFAEILKELKIKFGDYTLLLPAYIGYSPNEGSGIYDPIVNNNIKHIFYKIDAKINIDIDDYKQKINSINDNVVLLIVNYFGYVDKNIEKVVEIAKEKQAFIIEDNAHALYTDYIDKVCGIYSNVSIYSLHKMLPLQDGGMIRLNNNTKLEIRNALRDNINPFEYDFFKIARKRKENATIIENELKNIEGIEIIRSTEEYNNQTPQTYPIVIKNGDKNKFYYNLNNEGYGVVSLYHTMIEPLRKDEYFDSNYISSHILNLPVHQDVNEEQIKIMCKKIKILCEEK